MKCNGRRWNAPCVCDSFENGTSCSYYECVKDAQEHASDGLVTDALMLRMFFFVRRPEIGHYTSEYVLLKKSRITIR
jgi:hypothetical protein